MAVASDSVVTPDPAADDLAHGVGADSSGPLDLGPLVPIVSALAAMVALYVAYRLVRSHPLWLSLVLWVLVVSRALLGNSGRAGQTSNRADARPVPPRGVGWFGVATAVFGLTATVPLFAVWLGLSPRMASNDVLVGGIVTGAIFLPALLHRPGASTGSALRARRALDGAFVGLCLMFCGWALLVAPHGRLDSPAFWIVMFHCCVLATAMITAMRPGRLGWLLCGAGVCTATVALGTLAFVLSHHPSAAWQPTLAVLLVATPLLMWRGTAALDASPARPRRISAVPRATVIAVPAALALTIALEQLASGARVGRAEMMIGTLAAVAVGLRQSLPLGPTAAGAPTVGSAMAAASTAPRPAPIAGLATRDPVSSALAQVLGQARGRGALILVRIDSDRLDGRRDEIHRKLAGLVDAVLAADGAEESAYWSGPGFAVLTRATMVRAYGLATRLVAALTEPVDDAPAGTSAWAGLADLDGTASAEDLERRAVIALGRARQLGPGRVEWYDPPAEDEMRRAQVIEEDLPGALCRGELDLIYQPIMDLVSEAPLAVEALLRWRHPQLGTLMPADVIPAAEQTGLIGEIGHWVRRQACSQLASWRRDGRDLSMAVNVCARELTGGALVAELPAVLASHDLPPDRLVLEIAESGIQDAAEVTEEVKALHEVGVRVALDEFGAGAMSLGHLRRLSIDLVKIGQPLLDEAGACAGTRLRRDGGAVPMLDLLVGMGRRLGVDVVVQQLEARAQLNQVLTAGCRLGQGHFFAHPAPAERTEAFLDGYRSTWRPRAAL
jgi:EAL domain-containing protein (putative c-di-GMP-specific phosphodiesterase class I)